MLMGDEHYVIIKFVSGEQVMAVLLQETEENLTITYPMQIRMFPIVGQDGIGKEHVTATPWSKFAEDPELTINKRNVLFIKNLHHVLIPHYSRLVVENEENSTLHTGDDSAESLDWEEDDEEQEDILTMEELQKRLKTLESITNKDTKEDKTFVEGNDTIH
jgi:hypothetical protein